MFRLIAKVLDREREHDSRSGMTEDLIFLLDGRAHEEAKDERIQTGSQNRPFRYWKRFCPTQHIHRQSNGLAR